MKKPTYSLKTLSEAGFMKFSNFLLILVFALFMYFTLQVVRHYYNFHEIEGLIVFQAKTAEGHNDVEINKTITAEMDKLGLNAEHKDLEVTSGRNEVVISLAWQEFLELYINEDYNWVFYTFEFSIYEVGKVSSRRKR